MKGITLIVTFLAYSASFRKVEGNDDVLAKFSSNESNSNRNLTVLESWQNMEKTLKEMSNYAVKMVLPVLMDNAAKLNLSKECMKNSILLISGVKNIKAWAMRFLDSSAKFIDGMMAGSVSSFGDYDECVATEVKSTKLRDKGKVLFRGQYCTIDMAPPISPKTHYYKVDDVIDELKNFSQRDTAVAELAKYANSFHVVTLRLGICIPSGCSLEDVDKIAHMLSSGLSINAKASRCELKEENKFTPLIITVITCYSFAGFLMFVGSLIDIYAYYRKIGIKNKFLRVLVAFSLFTNFRKFVNTESSSDTIGCLNGLRFLSMSWIILLHTYAHLNFQIYHSLNRARPFLKDFAFQTIAHGSLAVDTFFYMGGLLVTFVNIKRVRIQGQKFKVGLHVFRRLWRILPAYCFVILFIFMIDLLGSGPIWYETFLRYFKPCYDSWWTNLIFINNFYGAKNMCIPHYWYIASDFQLFVGALAILIPMLKWPKAGILLSILVILASVIFAGVGTYANEFPPGMLSVHLDREQMEDYFTRFYFTPFLHASPYCIGLLSGYLLATKPDLKLPRIIQVLGWILAFICNMSALYGVWEWNSGNDSSFWPAILYAAFSRTAWTLGVAWMVICCATGHGGVVNHILSWKSFVILGRLTFLAYLIHPLVLIIYDGNMRTRVQPDHFVFVWKYFGHMCATYGIAFVGSMLIESPFTSIENIFLIRKKKEENISAVKEDLSLNGSFKLGNGDIIAIVPKNEEESNGIDNRGAVYKL